MLSVVKGMFPSQIDLVWDFTHAIYELNECVYSTEIVREIRLIAWDYDYDTDTFVC